MRELGFLILGLFLVELTDWFPRLAVKLLSYLTRHLEKSRGEIRQREWIAMLDQVPGRFSKLFYVLTFIPFVIKSQKSMLSVIGNFISGTIGLLSHGGGVWVMSLAIISPFDGQHKWDVGTVAAVSATFWFTVVSLKKNDLDFSWYPDFEFPEFIRKTILTNLFVSGIIGLAVGSIFLKFMIILIISSLLWKVILIRRANRTVIH